MFKGVYPRPLTPPGSDSSRLYCGLEGRVSNICRKKPANWANFTYCKRMRGGSILWFVVQTSLYGSWFCGAKIGNKRKILSKPVGKNHRRCTTTTARQGVYQDDRFSWRQNELGICADPSCLSTAWRQSSISLSCLSEVNCSLLL